MTITNSSPTISRPYFTKTIRPSRKRYLVYRLLVTLAAYQLCFVLLHIFYESAVKGFFSPVPWLGFNIIYMGVYGITLYFATRTFVEDLSIKIVNGKIEGPTGVKRERVSFPVEKLDLARTHRRTWLNRFLMYRYLWSTDGKRILLLAHSFDQIQLDLLFVQLDLV